MNALHVPDFYKDWVDKKLIDPSGINLYLLYEPKGYSVKEFPTHKRKEVEDKYEVLIRNYLSQFDQELVRNVRQGFEAVVKHMNEKPLNSLDAFRRRTAQLDAIREESFDDVFPELKGLL